MPGSRTMARPSSLSVRLLLLALVGRLAHTSGYDAGQIISQMLPLLMMRHRRISRAKWKDCETSNGKHWIEQVRPVVFFPHPYRPRNAHHPLVPITSHAMPSPCHPIPILPTHANSRPTTCRPKSFSSR